MLGDDFARALGKLVANLQSLEFMLRDALYRCRIPPERLASDVPSLFDLQIGAEVVENAYTDYSTLGQLIDAYNREIAVQVDERIDKQIVSIRDAIAHGRVLGTLDAPHFTLVKFGRARNGKVGVEVATELTEAWLNTETRRVANEIKKLAERLTQISPPRQL